MSDIKRTPLFNNHVALNAQMVDFAGWEMPIKYSSISEEHLAVRNDVGMFDVSHMGEVIVKGKEATQFVQKLVTNDVESLEDNQVLYAMMCYPDGGVVDDLLVYKYSLESYLLVINASNIEKDFAWISEQAENFNVTVENLSSEFAEIAIQGPNAQKILQKLANKDLSVISFFYFTEDIQIIDEMCLISRTGYTGEDGFEIYMPNNSIEKLWNALLELGVKPIGLGARDTLRFEASLPLYGNELSKDITPLEAGFSKFVKLDTDFIGRDSLVNQKEKGLSRRLAGIELQGKGIPRHGYPVLDLDGNVIGEITTGYVLPEREQGLAFGLIDFDFVPLGTKVQVQIRKKLVDAVVVKKRFMNKNYKK